MNNKEIIVKKILDSGIYKHKPPKHNISFIVNVKSTFIAIRFIPAIIREVIKHGR